MSTTYLSIAELNQRIATLLERSVPLLWVQGEISNLKQYPSGHWYFSLKDEDAQVRAVMFRPKVALLKWQPKEGDHVQAYVSAGLYAARGDFQLTVESMRPAGMGTLYERFMQLKDTLAREGLFDSAHKKPLPNFVRKIGIVTSSQAAALRDVAHTLARRAPHIEAFLYPCLVQGEQAAGQIARAIERANQNPELDALLVIRGGGSLEDLWAFNEPEVAHALYNSRLPTICGVGHETDTTIADYVADVRAATPTAAAELISSPSQADWAQTLNNHARALQRLMQRHLERAEQDLDRSTLRLLTPAQRLAHTQAQIEQWSLRLKSHFDAQLSRTQHKQHYLFDRLQRVQPQVTQQQHTLQQRTEQLTSAHARLLERQRHRVLNFEQHLVQLNPENVLNRGFAYVQTQNGDIVYNASTLHAGDGITIQLSRGRVIGTVNHTESE